MRIQIVLASLIAVGIPSMILADQNDEQSLPLEPVEIQEIRTEYYPHQCESNSIGNLLQVASTVYSGAVPVGDEAFQAIQRLGVRTIISVDGMPPNVELASKYGLKYVHLPHGYDGISKQRAMELAKAVRTVEPPIFIHCHHGLHRSPAAAATACVIAGIISPDQAAKVLRIAGTDANYRGLFQSVHDAKKVDPRELDDLEVVFSERVELPKLTREMVSMDELFEQLKLLINANEITEPKSTVWVEGRHKALLLRESYTELVRSSELSDYSDRFRELLIEGERLTTDLEEAIDGHDNDIGQGRILSGLNRLTGNCKSCHQEFRDVPLAKK